MNKQSTLSAGSSTVPGTAGTHRKLEIRPCSCGATPKYREARHGRIRTMQLWCRCGKPCGAILMYTNPVDKKRMAVAGIDGWNLAT
jgi:hypothetical protein